MEGPGNDSSSRATILGSLLRGRPRQISQSDLIVDLTSGSAASNDPRRRTMAPNLLNTASNNNNNSGGGSSGLTITAMLRRRRSAGNVTNSTTAAATAAPPIATSATAAASLGFNNYSNNNNNNYSRPTTSAGNTASSTTGPFNVAGPPPPGTTGTGPTHRIRLVPHLDSRRSLRFEAIGRDLREGDAALRIGRFTDRSGLGLAAVNALGSNKLAFRSKVVSRAHAEIWVELGGRFYVKDTKSSSGTFLNHVRLSAANTESRPFQIKDGDILQLGVDYQGGTEDIYKSVKIRVEIGREWQAAANAFNTNALKNLRSLALPASNGKQPAVKIPTNNVKIPASNKSNIPDCCICLFNVTIRQALFIAPCSHTFHYKCIRPLIEAHHPSFSCPLCRTYADLEDDVEVEIEFEEEEDNLAEAEGDIPHLPKGISSHSGAAVDQDEDVDDNDIGIDIDAMDAGTPNSFDGQNHIQGGENRSNSRLGQRAAENGLGGAETEVEGEGVGLNGMRTARGMRRGGGTGSVAFSSRNSGPGGSRSGAGSPLNADLTDEADEVYMMAVDPASQIRSGELGMYVDGGDAGPDGIIDMDATVGGKRKR